MKVTQYFVSLFIVCYWEGADVSGNCTSGKYGSNCEYDCHCGAHVVCNQVRGCNGNCAQADGWFGSTCQARNVALRRPASHSPHTYCTNAGVCYNASLAVDGRRGHSFLNTPCTQAGTSNLLSYNAEWSVTLNQSYDIYRFIIDNRGDCCAGRINRFLLYVGQSSVSPGNNYRECYRDTTQGDGNSAGPGDVIHGHCKIPVRGDIIQIRQTNNYQLTLCEVLVYICGTGWYGEECTRECQTTTQCKRCDSNQSQCQECVLGKWGPHCRRSCYCLNGVPCDKLYGVCPHGCAAGYKGISCQILCTPGDYGSNCLQSCGYCDGGRNNCYITTGHCPIVSPRCQRGYYGDKCDKECVPGKYGADCLERCGQCSGGQTLCDRFTGRCPDRLPRCKAGWSGINCKKGCVPGQYAADCFARCGHCSGGQTVCDRTTGRCPDNQTPRCMVGWSGINCKTACTGGTYGADCKPCGQCRGGTVKCDTISGVCPQVGQSRCSDGYLGELCDTICPDGTYGNLCKESCGRCYGGNLTCDHRSGVCQNCAAGWQGDLCNHVCSLGTYGPNCKLTCSVNCLDGPTGCDIFSGVCIRGCRTGFAGDFCDQSVAVVVVASVIGVVVVVVLVIGIIILRRTSQGSLPTEIPPTSARTTATVTNIAEPTTPRVIPESASTSDAPNYYNGDEDDDNEYECVFENEYNTIRFSQVEKKANYFQLS